MESHSSDAPSRYVVGIDLGTTNCAVAYVDTQEEPRQIHIFGVPQVVAPGHVEARETLPSFYYQPAAGEFPDGAMRLPWSEDESSGWVGVFARDHGATMPGRVIASAKSWLCHTGVDRTAELLPWHAAPDVDRLSPVDTSSRYLQHIRDAWDSHFPDHPMSEQELILTLPASFDEVARDLTARAAMRAGLPRAALVEEPQAAFYAWLYTHTEDWERQVAPGDRILVCDLGGGTCDFTLIRARQGKDGKIMFHRVAVGDHLMLGGDNLDLALAHHMERRIGDRSASAADQKRLEPRQFDALIGACRNVKEEMLGEAPPAERSVHLPGSGSKLLGGGLQIDVTRDEVRQVLLDGFFPPVSLDEKPIRRASGFQEFGLPFVPDPAVTRHLAAFLTAHRQGDTNGRESSNDADAARPDIVLFNGGVFASEAIRTCIIDALCGWFHDDRDPSWSPRILDGDRLDLAVARGAAYFGMVRRGEGVRIESELARTYYIGVESEPPAAVCVIPAGAQAGHTVDLSEPTFQLLVSEPVEFPLYVSSTRLTDKPGKLIPFNREQMTALPAIRTVLKSRKNRESSTVSVQLHAGITEIGTLDMWCSQLDGKSTWRMQFDVRSATQSAVPRHQGLAEQGGFLEESSWSTCSDALGHVFGTQGTERPEGLTKRLTRILTTNRRDWPPSLLRRIWECLMEMEAGRRRSHEHEARWLNLVGFALRPGYGFAVDDWRVAQTWRSVHGRLTHSGAKCRNESWIMWRRIAGGLSSGQQRELANPLLGLVRSLHQRMTGGKKRRGETSLAPHELIEVWRLLGSLELLDGATKIELGQIVLDLLRKPKAQPTRPALLWTLGRLGARVPSYGPLNTVISQEVTADWLQSLVRVERDEPVAHLAVMQMARRTNDRYRDVSEELRRQVLDWLELSEAPAHFCELVRDGGRLDAEEQDRVFGEALPKGLSIR